MGVDAAYAAGVDAAFSAASPEDRAALAALVEAVGPAAARKFVADNPAVSIAELLGRYRQAVERAVSPPQSLGPHLKGLGPHLKGLGPHLKSQLSNTRRGEYCGAAGALQAGGGARGEPPL